MVFFSLTYLLISGKGSRLHLRHMFNCTYCISLGILSINGWVENHNVPSYSYYYIKLLTNTYSLFSALFLSEKAPFNFPGFSIMCIGIASVRTYFNQSSPCSLCLFRFYNIVEYFVHICMVLSCLIIWQFIWLIFVCRWYLLFRVWCLEWFLPFWVRWT